MASYMATLENFKDVLSTHGVAVIPSVLSTEECVGMNGGMWDSLERLTSLFETPIERDDESTWVEFFKFRPMHAMLMQHYKIGHAQYVWDVRQNPKVANVFAKLWDVAPEELLVSFDGVAIHFPPEVTHRGWYRNEWFHTDQSLKRNSFECVQGLVTSREVREGDATFTFLDGSHALHKELADAALEKGPGDWVVLTPEQLDFCKSKGCVVQSVVCPAGSIVLWDSRTIHAGKEPVKGRPEMNFRNVVYVCMTPRKLATSRAIAKKKEIFEKQRMTTHWPHRPKMFGVLPRTYGNEMPTVATLRAPVLTDLGKKLAGF